MNGPSEHERREAAADEAVDWLLRVEAPDAAEQDWLALQAWLEASPDNRAAFDRAERTSAELGLAASDLLHALRTAPRPPAARRALPRDARRRRIAPWRLGAGIAAAAAAAAAVVVLRPEPVAPAQVYQTAKGESRTVELADGSRLHLNTATRVSVRLDRHARQVDLAEGEAAFQVARDVTRPFLIAAGDRTVRVVGTEFDVLRHRGRLQVTVLSGAVAVQNPRPRPNPCS